MMERPILLLTFLMLYKKATTVNSNNTKLKTAEYCEGKDEQEN